MDWLRDQIDSKKHGRRGDRDARGRVRVLPLRDTEELADWEHRRPLNQWWMRLRPMIDVLGSRLAVRTQHDDTRGGKERSTAHSTG